MNNKTIAVETMNNNCNICINIQKMFPLLNLPAYEMKTKRVKGQIQVFDPIRKKYITLTPEEFVRQHIINFLIYHKGYPAGLITIESPVKLNNMQQRADIIAFNKQGNPLLVIECKSFNIELSQKTYLQAARYNLSLKAPYLMVSNGIKHFCSRINIKEGSFELLSDIPDFNSISELL